LRGTGSSAVNADGQPADACHLIWRSGVTVNWTTSNRPNGVICAGRRAGRSWAVQAGRRAV